MTTAQVGRRQDRGDADDRPGGEQPDRARAAASSPRRPHYSAPLSCISSIVPCSSLRSTRLESETGIWSIGTLSDGSGLAPLASGYSFELEVKNACDSVGEQRADEGEGFRLAVARFEHADAGQQHQRAEPARREVDGDGVVGAFFADRLGDVVVVDQADVDFAFGDRVADRDVVGEGDGAVVDHFFQPLLGAIVAILGPQRGHILLHGRGGGAPTDPVLPLRRRQPEGRGRQFGLLDDVFVVGDHPGAAGDPDPATFGVAVARRHQVEDVLRQLGQQPGFGDGGDRPWLLGEEDVGWGGVALLDQGRGEVGGFGEADLDVAVGFGLVAVDGGADRGRDPARVEGDPFGFRLVRAAAAVFGAEAAAGEDDGGEDEQGGEQPRGMCEWGESRGRQLGCPNLMDSSAYGVRRVPTRARAAAARPAQVLRRRRRRRRPRPRRPRGGDLRPARPQRLRQDDDAAADRRASSAPTRARSRSAARR